MNSRQQQSKPMTFWILWIAILTGLPMMYAVLGQSASQGPGSPSGFPLGLVAGIGPLVASIVIRWAVLPRIDDPAKALPIFVVGMALGEACGVIGIILGGEHKTLLFIAGLLGVLQYVPFFASRFGQEPANPPHTRVIK